MTTSESQGTAAAFPAGQRLVCDACGSVIEIIKACTCQPPDQVLQCCGREMRPASKDDAAG